MLSTRRANLRALVTAAAVSGLVAANSTPDWQIINESNEFSPDRMGEVPIRGFRLDKPYGSDDNKAPIEGWTLQLNMTENSRGETDFNRFVVRLWPPHPPAEGSLWDAHQGNWLVSEDVSKSWDLVTLGFSAMDFPETAGGNDKEEGSCPDSLFSEQCRKDYIAKILKMFNGDLTQDFTPPQSCKLRNTSSNSVVPIRTNTSENFLKDSLFAWSFNVNGQAWIDFKDKTWPFIFVWAPAPGSGEELTAEHIQFNCVKADTNGKTGQPLPQAISNNGTATAIATMNSSSTSSSQTSTSTGSSTPVPTAGASLQAPVSKIMGAAAALVVAFGVGLF